MKHVTVLALVLAAFGAGTAPSQGQVASSKVSVPDDLVAEPLERARRALDVEDVERAVKAYQSILDRLPNKVTPAKLAPRRGDETDKILPGDRFSGAREHVMRLIRDLGPDGLKVYRGMVEPSARRMLERARRTNDELLLRSIVVRYFLTEPGKQASIELVDFLLEAGRFAEARIQAQDFRRTLERFGESTAAKAAAVAREGLAYWGEGDRERLVALGREVASSEGGDPELEVAGERTTLRAFLARLTEAVGEPVAAARDFKPTLRILRREAWKKGIDRNTETGNESYWDGRSYRRIRYPHYPVLPQIDGGVVYSCDGRKVVARSLFTGGRVWPAVQAPVRSYAGSRNRNLYYHVALDEDYIFAYLEGAPFTQGQRAFHGFQPIEEIPARKLLCIDRNTGETVWSHLRFAARDAKDAQFIKSITINSPPVIVGDTLYVGATFYLGGFRQWLCAFERDTGQLRWRTYVGQGQMELNMFGNPVREATPGHVLENEGILYYSTNVGSVAAVEAATGSIRWISAYPQSPIPRTQGVATQERVPGWMPSAPASWRDRIFVAPTDSPELCWFDKASGTMGTVPYVRRNYKNGNLYFLGIHDDKLLVAGSTVVAIDPERMQRVWETTRLSGTDRGMIQGRPAVAAGRIVFSTRDEHGRTEVHLVDLASGRFIETKNLRTSGRTGNVVITPESLLICGQESMRAWFDPSQVQQQLLARMRRSPEDPDLPLRLGDIQFKDASYGDALRSFTKALRLAENQKLAGRKQARRARLALYNTWLKLANENEIRLEGGPHAVPARYEKALEYATNDLQRVEALRRCLRWAVAHERTKSVTETARRMLEEHGSVVMETAGDFVTLVPDLSAGTMVPAGLLASLVAGSHLARSAQAEEAVDFFQECLTRYPDVALGSESAWAYAGFEIKKLMATAGNRVYAKQEKAARDLLAQAGPRGDVESLRRLLANYPQSSVIEGAYLALSRALLERKAFAEALRDMQVYMTRFGNLSAEVLAQNARCLDRLGAHDSARQVLRRLVAGWGERQIEKAGGGTESASSFAANLLKGDAYKTLGEERPLPKLGRGLSVTWRVGDAASVTSARVVTPKGREPDAMRQRVLVHLEGSLRCLEVANGNEVWSKSCVRFPGEMALWHDGLLVMVIDQDVVAVDASTGNEAWRSRLVGQELYALAAGHGKAYLLLHDVLSPAGLLLRGVNLVTGSRVQESFLPGLKHGSLAVGNDIVVVHSQREGRGFAIDGLTGKIVRGHGFKFVRYQFRPAISDNGLLIFADPDTRRREFRMVGRDPVTWKDRWEYRASTRDVTAYAANKDHVILRVRRRVGGGSRRGTERTVVVVDANTGQPVFTQKLRRKPEDILLEARIADGRLYLLLKVLPDRGAPSQFVRVCDLESGKTLWETPYFSGRIDLALVPTQDFLILRRSRQSVGSLQGSPDGALFFLDRETGKATDRIEIGNVSYVQGDSGLAVKDGTLIMTLGPEVRGLR